MPANETNTRLLSPEEAVRRVARAREVIIEQLHKLVVGHDELIEQLLIALMAGGHCLTVGVAGLAKSLLVSTLARVLHLKFSHIRFTPDTMPQHVTGSELVEEDEPTGQRVLRFARGPIFAGVVLADEINRTPPLTQAVILEAMQEHHVTVGGNVYELNEPFFVVATENPTGQQGRYPLPEAQRDHFLLSATMGYPGRDEEREIVKATTRFGQPEVRTVLRPRDIVWIQQIVRQIPATDHVVEYAVDLVRATRPGEADATPLIKECVTLGAGTRAGQHLIIAAKARALLNGRCAVASSDVRAVAHPVLRHRLALNYAATSRGITPDNLIDQLLKTIKEPLYGETPTPPALIVVDANPTSSAKTPRTSTAGPREAGSAESPSDGPGHSPKSTDVDADEAMSRAMLPPVAATGIASNWPPGASPGETPDAT